MNKTKVFMLDTNIIDEVHADAELADLMRQHAADVTSRFLISHVQIDEVEAMPATKDERRQTLIQLLMNLPFERVNTRGFVFGVSRFDFSTLASDDEGQAFDELQIGNDKHSEDVLIAQTAAHHGATFVSCDKRSPKVAHSLGVECVDVVQFKTMLHATSLGQ